MRDIHILLDERVQFELILSKLYFWLHDMSSMGEPSACFVNADNWYANNKACDQLLISNWPAGGMIFGSSNFTRNLSKHLYDRQKMPFQGVGIKITSLLPTILSPGPRFCVQNMVETCFHEPGRRCKFHALLESSNYYY